MRKCSEFSELYTDYIDGALNTETRTELEAHLEKCKECTKQLENFKDLIKMLHELPVEPIPADFTARSAARRKAIKKPRFFLLPALGAAVAAMVIGVILINQQPVNKSVFSTTKEQAFRKDTESADIESNDNVVVAKGIKRKGAKTPPTPAPQQEVNSNKVSAPKAISYGRSGNLQKKPVPETTVTYTNMPPVKNMETKKEVAALGKNSPVIQSKPGDEPGVNVAKLPAGIAADSATISNDSITINENNFSYSNKSKIKEKSKSDSLNASAKPAEIESYGGAAIADSNIATDASKNNGRNGKDWAPTRKGDPNANGSAFMVPHASIMSAVAEEPQILLTDVTGDTVTIKTHGKIITAKVNDDAGTTINKSRYLLIKQDTKLNNETAIILQKAAAKDRSTILIADELLKKQPANNVNENSGLSAISASLDAEIYFSGKFITILPKNLQ